MATGTQPGTVVLEGVSKRFRRHTVSKHYSTVKTSLLSRLFGKAPEQGRYVQALTDFNAVVPPGSALGVIGRNGSGKSTLLKLIAGIYRPDAGTVRVAGRISALIELGAGFHPEFTGRENVYLGGVMFGLSRREIDRRFDDIVSFAELEEFIDDPVRTYSSGMYMRLGFSLAIHTDPDILLVDEVLAVGDASFIHRCHDRISDLKRRGKTLVFVAHDLDSVARWCDEALWLDKGVIKKRGEPRWVIDSYLQNVEEDEERSLGEQNEEAGRTAVQTPEEVHRWGNGDAEILTVRMLDQYGRETWLFHGEDALTIEVEYELKRDIDDLVFGIGILRADGLAVFGTNTDIEQIEVPANKRGRFRVNIERLGLVEHSYFLDVAAHKADGTPYDYHHLMHKFSVRSSERFHGVFSPVHRWEMEGAKKAEKKKIAG